MFQQEAVDMFVNASTESESPEQLCLLSFLSASAYVCSAHRHALFPYIKFPEQVQTVVSALSKRKSLKLSTAVPLA